MAEVKILQKAVDNTTIHPRTLLGELIGDLAKNDEQLPVSGESFCRQVQRTRQKVFGHIKLPKSFGEIDTLMPSSLRLTNSGHQFYYADIPVGHSEVGSMVFISPAGKSVLRKSETWFCDGTFSRTPQPFRQIYCLYGHLNDGRVIPCVFSLLPNKAYSTYKALFSRIKNIVNEGKDEYSPTRFMSDFEYAAQKGFLDNYKDCKIAGCYFHFTQNIERNINTLGCKTLFNTTQWFQTLVAMMRALAFVPMSEIEKVWTEVLHKCIQMHQNESTTEINRFVTYFEETYIGKVARGRRFKPKIKYEVWSKHQDVLAGVACTNNGVEACNGSFNRSIHVTPSLWEVIEAFKKEESLASKKVSDNNQRGIPAKKARKHACEDKKTRLLNLAERYSDMEPNMYIREVINVINI